jgi:hypothetical protein
VEGTIEGQCLRCWVGGTDRIFYTVKVPRQCPLVLLIKVGWREGKV